MEYTIYVESNMPRSIAYVLPSEDGDSHEFVESGFGEYELEKGIEVIKQNGNIADCYLLSSKKQAQELAQLLLDKGLPREQISSLLLLD